MEDGFSHIDPEARHARPDTVPSGFSISIAPSRPVPAAESWALSIRSHSLQMCSHQGRRELRSEDAYVGAVLIGAPRPTEATRSHIQAAHTLPMTVLTQDDVGWTWLSQHGTAPAPRHRPVDTSRGGDPAGSTPSVAVRPDAVFLQYKPAEVQNLAWPWPGLQNLES